MKAESVELNDLEMYYETEGAGEPLLLLHGGTGCHQYDDMNFAPPSLSRIVASTLIVYGARGPLYPVAMAVATYRAIPKASLWVAPHGSHSPVCGDAAPQFAQTALDFFRTTY